MQSVYCDLLSRYPSGAAVLSQLAGKSFNVDPGQVVVGNGAAELIAVLFDTLQGTTLVPVPTFGEYTARISADRLKTLESRKADCSHTVEEIKAAADKTDNLVLVNPDNPSGYFIDKTEMLGMIDELLLKGKKIIVDESFCDFADKERRYSLWMKNTCQKDLVCL